MPKDKTYNPAGFDKVDKQADPAAYLRFMEDSRRVTTTAQQKNTILALLRLQPGDRVLDVGCGLGDDVRVMAGLVGKQGKAVGLDSSEAMIAEARKRAEGGDLPSEFFVGSAYELPFADGTFNAVSCDRVFEHLSEPLRALAEIVRVARPGANIALASSDVDNRVFDLPNCELVRKIVHADCDRRPNGWAGRRLWCYMKEAGLQDLSASGVVHCSGDYDLINGLIQIEKEGQRAAEAGQVTQEESAAWWSMLEQAKRSGHFFFASTHFVVGGRKP